MGDSCVNELKEGEMADVQDFTQKVLECAKVDGKAPEGMEAFLKQDACRKILADWALNPDAGKKLALSDMSDLYKLSMVGVFEQVHKHRPDMKVCFYLKVRERSEAKLEHLFSNEEEEVVKIRLAWLQKMFEIPERPHCPHILTTAHEAVALTGKVVNLETMEWAKAPVKTKVSLRIFLRDKTQHDEAYWGEIIKHDGTDLHQLRFATGPHAGFGTIGMHQWAQELGDKLEVVALAEGPWAWVTWFETSTMQVTAECLASLLMHTRKWSEAEFYARSLRDIISKVSFNNEHLKDSQYIVYLFAGRRSPRLGMHLLQNLYLAQHLSHYGGTSSLFSYRVFREYGWIETDGNWTSLAGLKAKRLSLIGTHAHEGTMVFAGLAAEADSEFGVPISTLLWHMNYWLHTANFAALPDTYGSGIFAHLMDTLHFPEAWMKTFEKLHSAEALPKALQEDSKASIFRALKGSMMRQDSGTLESFSKIFKDYKWLASEIGDNGDIEDSAARGYLGCGAGGYFGEKPWKEYDPKELGGRLDLVAKVCRVRVEAKNPRGTSARGVRESYPVKLGDFGETGKWYGSEASTPAKFACGPTVSEEMRSELFHQYREWGTVEQGQFKHENAKRAAAAPFGAQDRQQTFDKMWNDFGFIGK